MAVLGSLIFVGALGVAMAAIWVSIVPQWQRIVRLSMGHVETGFTPLATLAVAERQIAVRRWAAQPVPAAIRQLRAAA